MKVIGEFSTYAKLHKLMRERAIELGVSRETIDEVAGMTPGYAAKLLAPRPMKRLGVMSLPAILPVLGIKLVVCEDEQALRKYADRIKGKVGRPQPTKKDDAVYFALSKKHMRQIGTKGGGSSRKNVTPKKASKLGRESALIQRKKMSAEKISELAQYANKIRWKRAK